MVARLTNVSGRSSVVECHLAKVNVESSNLFARSNIFPNPEPPAQALRRVEGQEICQNRVLRVTLAM